MGPPAHDAKLNYTSMTLTRIFRTFALDLSIGNFRLSIADGGNYRHLRVQLRFLHHLPTWNYEGGHIMAY